MLRAISYDKPYEHKLFGGKSIYYTVACGSVVTKKMAHYGYFESRFKTHNTSCAAGFWMSTLGKYYNIDSKSQPNGFPSGVYSQELDICETVGRKAQQGDTLKNGKIPANWNFFNNFGDGMNYCVHCWYTPSSGEHKGKKLDYKIAHNTSLKTAKKTTLSEDFNTYGVWWRNKSQATYYLNDECSGVKHFVAHQNKPWVVDYCVNTLHLTNELPDNASADYLILFIKLRVYVPTTNQLYIVQIIGAMKIFVINWKLF